MDESFNIEFFIRSFRYTICKELKILIINKKKIFLFTNNQFKKKFTTLMNLRVWLLVYRIIKLMKIIPKPLSNVFCAFKGGRQSKNTKNNLIGKLRVYF